MRWGGSQHRFRVSDLGATEIVRDDKKRRFGKGGEERIRVRFGGGRDGDLGAGLRGGRRAPVRGRRRRRALRCRAQAAARACRYGT